MTTFIDPPADKRPVVFRPGSRVTSVVGQPSIPTNWAIETSVTSANLAAIVFEQGGAFFTDRDIFSTSVLSVPLGVSYPITLHASSASLANCDFSLHFDNFGAPRVIYEPNSVAHVRSPSSGTGFGYMFVMDGSTRSFAPVGGYYPAVSLDLVFSPFLLTPASLSPVALPNSSSTMVQWMPAGVIGVVDILATLRIDWYSDALRTNKVVLGSPPVTRDVVFGLRFYATQANRFYSRVGLAAENLAIVDGLIPGEVRSGYWAANNELGFARDEASGIEIDVNGMAIQNGERVSVYRLPNPLE
jgi:hypothetical protein